MYISNWLDYMCGLKARVPRTIRTYVWRCALRKMPKYGEGGVTPQF